MPGPDHVKPALVAAADRRRHGDAGGRWTRRSAGWCGWPRRWGGWTRPVQKDPSIAADDPANGGRRPGRRPRGHHAAEERRRPAAAGPGQGDAGGRARPRRRRLRGRGGQLATPTRPARRTLLDGLRAAAPGVRFDLVPFHGTLPTGWPGRRKYDGGTLTATFYAGTPPGRRSPWLTRQDKAIDFNWRGGPADGVPHENFSARWTGKITPTATGPAQFVVRSDDGSRVKLDGQDDPRRLVRPPGRGQVGHGRPDGRADVRPDGRVLPGRRRRRRAVRVRHGVRRPDARRAAGRRLGRRGRGPGPHRRGRGVRPPVRLGRTRSGSSGPSPPPTRARSSCWRAGPTWR